MKKCTFLPKIRAMGILLMFLLTFGVQAQIVKNPVLTWDQQVGCIDFDDGGVESSSFEETIEEAPCVRICKNTIVNYSLNDANAADVQWQVNGGDILTSSNTGAQIEWDATNFGNLTVTILYPDDTSRILTICIEKVVSPTSYFEIAGIQPDQNTFCTLQSISFKNLSTDNGGSAIINYLWEFGDGNTSATKNPTHTYTIGGDYEVILTVTNSCGCISKHHFTIHIDDKPAVEISCASIVCEYDRATYSVNDGCGGKWDVIGGTIIVDNGTSIEVEWNQVDPEDGFGYVSYLSNCSCPSWTTVKIPVILQSGTIKGPGVVCEGDQAIFSLPQWPTTDFEWMIDGDPNHIMLVKNQQRNEIIVSGLTPGNYMLSVNYFNTLIAGGGCQGYSEIPFTVQDRPEITFDPAELLICEGTNIDFTTHLSTSMTWTVTYNNTLVHTDYNSATSYSFDEGGGSYVITADNNGCTSYPVVIDVIAKPIILNNISGPAYVCLNTPYTYAINESQAGYTYEWFITGGIITGNNTGNSVTAKFTLPTGKISVVKTIIVNGIKCESDAKERNVSQVNMTPIISHPSATTVFCPSSATTFTVNTVGTPDHITWSIVGTDATTNFGNIIDGINSQTATISFNEISTVSTGIVKVEVTKCGVKTFDTYHVSLKPKPVMSLGSFEGQCLTDENINLSVTTVPAISGDVMVSFDNGAPAGLYPFTSGVPFTIPNGFTNQTGVAQTQKIKVSVVGYCSYQIEAERTVLVQPEVKVGISQGYYISVCPANYGSLTLTSTIPTGITVAVYKWYKNNTLILGANSSNYTISGGTPQGSYYVEITVNGCTFKSPNVEVFANCNTSPNCTITPAPNVNIGATWSFCNTISANVTYTGSPTITWLGSEHLTLTGPSNTASTTFTTDVAGVHTVIAKLLYGTCEVVKTFDVIKNYQADLKADIECVNGVYNITLKNASSVYDPNIAPITYTYSGTGISGSPTGASYALTGVTPGIKTYTITAQAMGQPLCTATITLNLDAVPTTNFTLSPLTYCADEAVTLNVPGTYKPEYRYEWVFNSTSYIADNASTEIQFADPDSYPISLKISTPYGCIYESSAPVTVIINKAEFDLGNIAPTTADYCEGNELPLSYSAADPLDPPTNIIWMNDDVPVHTGMTYQPTQSGSYWPVLVDPNGCKFYGMAERPRNYTIRKPPHVSIVGTTTMCAGESTVITGIVTDNTVEHRWTGSSIPTGYDTWVTGAANTNLVISGLSPGTYTYNFHARSATDHSCSSSTSVQVVVHQPVSVTINMPTVTNCNPYTVSMSANGSPAGGTYLWSNGMTGQNINVPHGGVYQVTYKAPSGCSATYSIVAPHNPDRVLWIVPEGCYPNVCDAYLLGPLGDYEQYDWNVNNISVQSGGGIVPDQPVNDGGIFQLILTQDGCPFGSNMPNITPDIVNCPPPPCNFSATFTHTGTIAGGFTFTVTLFNPLGTWQSVYLSSFNNFGTFAPATHILSPGMNTITVSFYVNSNFYPGANDIFLIQGAGCTDQVPIRLSEVRGKKGEVKEPVLELVPNPTSEISTASYNVGTEYNDAQHIVVYDMLGVQRLKQAVNGKEGNIVLNVSNLPAGTYIVSLENNSTRITQQKLIKK